MSDLACPLAVPPQLPAADPTHQVAAYTWRAQSENQALWPVCLIPRAMLVGFQILEFDSQLGDYYCNVVLRGISLPVLQDIFRAAPIDSRDMIKTLRQVALPAGADCCHA
jgi:hypothetical protein